MKAVFLASCLERLCVQKGGLVGLELSSGPAGLFPSTFPAPLLFVYKK